jgi:hypothetical protein
MGPHATLNRLHGAAERDHQLQRRGSFAIGLPFRGSFLRRHNI